MKSLNFPCVMLEKENTIGVSVSEETLMNKFSLIISQKDLDEKVTHFKEPVLCHYYSVVNEAIRITKELQP